MAMGDRSAAGGGSALMGPMVVIPVLALVLNAAILVASAAGYNLIIPINILAALAFNVAPLFPAATALILGFALWQWGGMSQGRAWIAVLCLFLVPIVVSQIVNYGTGVLLMHLSDATVTNSQNFYFILFLKSAFSAASVLLVLAVADRRFRPWWVWVSLIILWAGGDTLLFGLFRNALITRDLYQWLYPCERVLGFILLAYALQRPRRPVAAA
jgi:hypothetical protein